jgi:hypothetical protein
MTVIWLLKKPSIKKAKLLGLFLRRRQEWPEKIGIFCFGEAGGLPGAVERAAPNNKGRIKTS